MIQKIKPNLVVDFDETLFETSPQIKMFLNQYFGIKIPLDDTEYMCGHSLHELVMEHSSDVRTWSRGRFYEILGHEFFASKKWHENISPILGVSEILPELAQKYTLHIATARQDSSRPVVEMLIEKFFPERISSIHFACKHLGNKKFQFVPKVDFIRSLPNVMGYIDDNPKETLPVCGLVPQVILFDPRGHHPETGCTSQRVAHWNEIAKVFL